MSVSARFHMAQFARLTPSCAILAGLLVGLGSLSASASALADNVKSTLHVFSGGAAGGEPFSGLTADANGNLFGALSKGGRAGVGIVFELRPKAKGKWSYREIYSFTGSADGGDPSGKLTFDGAGNLYGTTQADGNGNYGAVYQLVPNKKGNRWRLGRTFQFDGVGPNGNDGNGALPQAGVVLDSKGNLYGTALQGGQGNLGHGYGTVFELTPSKGTTWTVHVLHAFDGSDGEFPQAGLIMDGQGVLYGVDAYDGANDDGFAFEMQKGKSGWTMTDIHDFNVSVDGDGPNTTLVPDGAGNFYGSTGFESGTVFELSPTKGGRWTVTTLYQFPSGLGADGMAMDASGNLLGLLAEGGPDGIDSVFELSPTQSGSWTESDLYDFTGGADGQNPYGAPYIGGDGLMYGATVHGGDGIEAGDGLVFSLAY